MILSRTELKEVTGYATRRTVCACLQAMGVHYVLGIDRWPRVGREHMNEVLSGKKTKRRVAPNFEETA